MHPWSPNLWQRRQEYTIKKTISSINGAEKSGQLHIKEWNEYYIASYTKINSKCIKDLDARPFTIKLIKENIGKTLFDINHSKIFFDLPPRIKKINTKISKWSLVELKSFCTAKETKIRWKDNCQNGRKYLQMNNIQKFNLQNIQIAHGAQYQENKQPKQ